MTPKSLQDLMRAFPHLEEVSGDELWTELKAAPYSQVLHTLYARLARSRSAADATLALKQAAVRSADRGLLKELMTGSGTPAEPLVPAPVQPAIEQAQPTAPVATAVAAVPAPEEHIKAFVPVYSSDSPSITLEQLMADIEALQRARMRYEETVAAIESERASAPRLASAPALTTTSRASLVSPSPEAVNENLLSEIKSTRRKIKPESPRQAEQLEIIDLFIKSKSAVVRPPEGPVTRHDLTESQTSYSDNVISETLVDILLGQGKREKAIEVLRKLIWKYPQKKHLFAARIQELSQ